MHTFFCLKYNVGKPYSEAVVRAKTRERAIANHPSIVWIIDITPFIDVKNPLVLCSWNVLGQDVDLLISGSKKDIKRTLSPKILSASVVITHPRVKAFLRRAHNAWA